jgi:hypothetical protein
MDKKCPPINKKSSFVYNWIIICIISLLGFHVRNGAYPLWRAFRIINKKPRAFRDCAPPVKILYKKAQKRANGSFE